MFKTGKRKDSITIPVDYGSIFQRERTTGPDRLRIGRAGSKPHPFDVLLPRLKGPFGILYLLHTPRGGAQPGRYQSPELGAAQAAGFLAKHADFFALDARHDIWVHDFESSSTLVWDRHDIVYAYGLIEDFGTALREAGFEEGEVNIPDPHSHHYHEAFDEAETEVIEALEWRREPLKPEDQQQDLLKRTPSSN